MNDSNPFLFRQCFDRETFTYTYILADLATREALIIDSVIEQTERDLKLLKELGLELKYIVETHLHADHITGASVLRENTGAKIAVSKNYNAPCADIYLNDNDTISCGSLKLKAISTQGHTNSCMSIHLNNEELGSMVFTGDALFIRGTGRTDFQEGSSSLLYDNIKQKLFTLDRDTKIYPAHDYNGMMNSTIGEEIDHNPRVGGGKTKEEFISIMKNLKLGPPKKLDISVPANMKCGKVN